MTLGVVLRAGGLRAAPTGDQRRAPSGQEALRRCKGPQSFDDSRSDPSGTSARCGQPAAAYFAALAPAEAAQAVCGPVPRLAPIAPMILAVQCDRKPPLRCHGFSGKVMKRVAADTDRQRITSADGTDGGTRIDLVKSSTERVACRPSSRNRRARPRTHDRNAMRNYFYRLGKTPRRRSLRLSLVIGAPIPAAGRQGEAVEGGRFLPSTVPASASVEPRMSAIKTQVE